MSHFIALADCQCGCKIFVLDSERSPLSLLKTHRAQRAAKKLGRRFVDTRLSKSCPECKTEIDLTKPDERWIERASDCEMVRV